MMRRALTTGFVLMMGGTMGCAAEGEELNNKTQSLTVGAVDASLTLTSDWGAGYCADVIIANNGSEAVTSWAVTLAPNGSTIGNLWNGVRSGNVVGPVAHNGTVQPGASAQFGFCANGSGRAEVVGLEFDGGGAAPTATCDDGIQNQGESGVDCGGPCSACAPDETCDDGIQNQGETGVDCGGPCSACAPTETCDDGIQNQGESGVDCGGPCSACAPTETCDDGIQNQGESGVDCGGPCAACAPTESCDDGIQNQGETGIDCGGPCAPCSTGGGGSCDGLQSWVSNDWRVSISAGEVIEYQGQRYRANSAISYPNGSCAPNAPAGWCANWFTALGSCGSDGGGTPDPTCNDGIQNQGEAGVDCGGPCSACVPDPTCNDGIQNQGESGVDCGGPCAACVPDATCNDGIQNQGESGVDCGGPCAACVPDATCNDGIQNQGEAGVDCGGPCESCADFTCNGYATRYWDCCKPHCSWEANVPMSVEPAKICGANDQPLNNPNEGSACNGGGAYQCHDHAPRAVSSNLSYGFAAVSGGDICGRCYEVEFTGTGRYSNDAGSAALAGKRMVVQAVNIGGDVGSGQFDLLIPGGGVGLFNGCSAQWGVSNSELGAQYGGFLSACQQQGGSHSQIKQCVRNRCDSVFASRGLNELAAGCEWFVDWFEAADNPNLRYREVSCPADLNDTSNMARTDSPANACF